MAEDRYWPSLDGVRGVAIAAVVAFHLGFLGGGWLGVDVFFVLSGFLITNLLFSEQARCGEIRVGAFWARRARRLVPGLLLLLVALAVYTLAGGPAVVPAQLRSPAMATLLYFANWQQIAAGHSYFAQFQAVNPLQHTWSLAIEEQYYLVWPLLCMGLLALGRRRSLRTLVISTAVLATSSALWMGIAAHILGPNRAYLGTDTRMWELLLGGLGAMALRAAGPLRRPGLWRWATVVGAFGVAVGTALGTGPPGWMWDGGLVVIAMGVVVVVVGSVRDPGGPVARLLALGPLRWLGRISYSLYLWHWPVIVLLNTKSTGWSGSSLLIGRLATMLGAACVSYYAVERPLRRADWNRMWRRALIPAAIIGVVGVVLGATVPPVEASTGRLSLPPATRPAHSAAAIALPPGRVVSPADPLRAWIVGDSVMDDSAPGVTAALESTGDVDVVANSAFGGWGLSTDHTWPTDVSRIISQYHPEIVLGTWSWDDQLAQQHPHAYLVEMLQALRTILAPGDGVDLVVLLQFPQVGPIPYIFDPLTQAAEWTAANARQIAWNDIASEAVQFFPGRALYLSTAQLFAPGDRFFAWDRTPSGTWIRARKIDDTHMCPYGAAELGALVVNDLTPVLGLSPMAPGWQLGSWVQDPNFNDPPGACPADQPPPHYDGVPVPGPAS
ncbi:MAG TPA: acyltransferase family protein [Acidimicrobiales bacterium]|nr:acyltransferase family protein [Acidimicrobiales bacterium]